MTLRPAAKWISVAVFQTRVEAHVADLPLVWLLATAPVCQVDDIAACSTPFLRSPVVLFYWTLSLNMQRRQNLYWLQASYISVYQVWLPDGSSSSFSRLSVYFSSHHCRPIGLHGSHSFSCSFALDMNACRLCNKHKIHMPCEFRMRTKNGNDDTWMILSIYN